MIEKNKKCNLIITSLETLGAVYIHVNLEENKNNAIIAFINNVKIKSKFSKLCLST